VAYVSNDLTHFVGRCLPSDQSRYNLLAKIVREGVLLDPSHSGRRDPIFRAIIPADPTDGLDSSSYPNVRHDLSSKLSDNALVQFEIVCFCDIPRDELAIHCAKYGCFGLAFSKPFLIAQGASPVMYVPKPGSFEMILREHHISSGKLESEERKAGDRAAIVDDVFEFHNQLSSAKYLALQDSFSQAARVEDAVEVSRQLKTTLFYQTAIEAFLFGHLKFFDPTLSPDHIDNYYMEREWHVAGKVRFQQADIRQMFVSAELVDQARRDFRELADRVVALSS
jgi:hypothetical protein